MTGEVTLRGKVLEIGGVKEKMLAAYRSGLRQVIMPKSNEKDLRDVPEEVAKHMAFTFVERMDEVLHLALLPPVSEELADKVQPEPSPGLAGSHDAGRSHRRHGDAGGMMRRRSAAPRDICSSGSCIGAGKHDGARRRRGPTLGVARWRRDGHEPTGRWSRFGVASATHGSLKGSMTKLPERNLDVLRACAVLSVWFAHLTPVAWHRGSALGHLGVLAFFVHTALVLMSSIERAGGDASRGWCRVFYARRAARIYPLVWATIALCVLANLPYSPTEIVGSRPSLEVIHSWQAITANVLLVQNVADLPNVIGPLWSLPFEMQMYLLLPAAYLLAPARSGNGAFTGIVAVALGRRCSLDVREPLGFHGSVVIGFAPCFLAGVWAYARLRDRKQRPAHWRERDVVRDPARSGGSPGLVVPIMALPVDWVCVHRPGPRAIAATKELPESIVTRVAAQVAKYSYGIYLLHMPAWMIASRTEAAPAVRWALYVVLLVGMPVAAYHLIEAPAMRWMRRRDRPCAPHAARPVAHADAGSARLGVRPMIAAANAGRRRPVQSSRR